MSFQERPRPENEVPERSLESLVPPEPTCQPISRLRQALGPRRIVCLTEETTEWLYMLGQQDRIVGISTYTVRPRQARLEKPRVSAFIHANIDKILALRPDCVLGFSDLQADLAATLIRAGVQVTVFNQRSVEEIFSVLYQIAAMVGCADRGLALLAGFQSRLDAMRADVDALVAGGRRRPRVYFEEWYDPHISCIRWVSELLSIAGGDDVFPDRALMPLGKDRILADPAEIVAQAPDIMLASWCGKRLRPAQVLARPGWGQMPALRDGQLFEIPSSQILQPGPAALTDGVEAMHRIVRRWMERLA